MTKIYKFFFFLIIFLFLIIIISLTFNSNLRRTSLGYMISGYKLYMLVSIQSDLKKENLKLKSVEKKISKYIKNSKKIANGKSSLLIGIYDAINLVESSIINEKDFGIFENVLFEVVKLDPTLFNARVLLAKSLLANKKYEDAKKQILKAIDLNSLNHENYRILVRIEKNINRENNLSKICADYNKANLGGTKLRYKDSIFTGFNLNKFSIKFSNLNEESQNDLYNFSGINLNEYSNYEIIPKESLNFNNFNLYFNFPPGTILEIKEIKLYSSLENFKIPENDIFATSKNAFFLNSHKAKQIIFTKLDNEIINISLSKDYKNIEKMEINMKISKADITNQVCDYKNEKTF